MAIWVGDTCVFCLRSSMRMDLDVDVKNRSAHVDRFGLRMIR